MEMSGQLHTPATLLSTGITLTLPLLSNLSAANVTLEEN
jgi:hypothetical protein